jgi:RNA recognition motif-containing protein
MNTKVYVENLPAATTRGDLMNLFAPYGNVVDVSIAADHNNLQALGFGFVTMVTSEGARAAIQGLHGKQMATRTLIVTELRPPSLGPVGAQGPPKLPGQYHPLLPNLKKNGIIPTTPSRDKGEP